MYNFKRIMVGLDLSLIDKTLIEYTAFLSYYFRPEKIYFINVQPSLDIPDELRESFPEFDKPKDELLEAEMTEKVGTFFANYKDFDIEVEAIEGSARKEMLHWAHVKNVDLLIAGRKKELEGSGMVPQQLARKVSCSVLLVPEKVKMSLRDILVPVDFSEYCNLALEEARKISTIDPDVKIILQHAYEVPMGYTKTGKTEEEFARIMDKHAHARMMKFLEEGKHDTKQMEPVYTFNKEHHSPADAINKVAHEKKVDLIIIGARGRTALTALFLGSVAEKLIRQDSDIPLLVVKHKAKTFSFWEMLRSI